MADSSPPIHPLMRWLSDRFDLDSVIKFAQKKEVPIHSHSVWYYFGGLTLFFFIVQVITGILLLLYYRPGADTSFESLQFILTQVKFGWLIRNLHSWSANLMVLAAFIHMFSNFFTQAYRQPRELTWLTGMALFGITLAFGFSGYLLPWNELAFFATKVGTDIVGALPLIGKLLLALLRGGEDVTGATLTRFYGIHVAVLPMITAILLGLHLFFVQAQGMSEPISHVASKSPKRSMPFFPNFILRDLILWLLALVLLIALSVFSPWDLGKKADLFAPAPAGIMPEWYFMFMFQTLKLLPANVLFLEGELVGILGFGIAGLLWTLAPFLDKRSQRNQVNLLLRWIGVGAALFIVVMTVLGYVLTGEK